MNSSVVRPAWRINLVEQAAFDVTVMEWHRYGAWAIGMTEEVMGAGRMIENEPGAFQHCR